MREDMAQVIVERPRIKPFKTRKGRCRALDDLPKHEGMRRSHAERGDTKRLNENLAPLRRYLEGQVGRPWDKVYAEIAAHLRVDSTMQQHVRGHLRDFVAVTPRRNLSSWRSSIRCGLAASGFMSIPSPAFSTAPTGCRRRRRDNAPDARSLP